MVEVIDNKRTKDINYNIGGAIMIFNVGSNSTTDEVTAILTSLKQEVNNLMTEVKSEVITMLTEVTNSIGAVKSVQRGRAVGNGSNRIVININEVNPAKCLVLVSPSELSSTSYNYVASPYELTATTLTVTYSYSSGSSNNNISFSWQVIEFY